jgi:iron(III) transport system permease protein
LATLLTNSLLSSALATLLAVVFGLAVALSQSMASPLVRRAILLGAIAAFAMPPFAATNCWLHYLGNTGTWRAWLPVDLFSVSGVAWVLGLMLWPIPFAAAFGAWRTLEMAHLEAEPALRGARLLRWLLWPVASKAVLTAALLTFVIALNQFSVPAILQVKVLPVEFWIRFSTGLRVQEALTVVWPLILIPFAAWIVLRRADFHWPSETAPAPPAAFRRQLGTAWRVSAAVISVLALLLSLGLPLIQLLSATRTWSEFLPVLHATGLVTLNTFAFAALAACGSLLVGLMLWRFRGAALLWLFFLVPGMLLSIGLIRLLNRPALEFISRSGGIMVIALCLRYVAPAWALLRHAILSVDQTLIDAARLEGLRGWSFLRHVYWPRVAPIAVVAWYVVYLLCLWDVETTTLLYPPGAETLSIRVFNLLHYGHTAQVNVLCLMLMGLALAPALVAFALPWLRGRSRSL